MNIYDIIYFPLFMIYDYSKGLEVIQVDMTFLGIIWISRKNDMKSGSSDPSSSS